MRISSISASLCLLAAFSITGCDQFDPVRYQSFCDGPAPISMYCPQCRGERLAFECSVCQNQRDNPQCDPPRMRGPDEPGGSETEPGGVDGGPSSEPDPGGGGGGARPGGASGASGGGAGAGGMSSVPGGAAGDGAGVAGEPLRCTNDFDCQVNDSDNQHCDVSVQRCVQCMADDDCTSQACDLVRHVCVECNQDGDCLDPDKNNCDTRSFTCVDCVADSGCSDTVFQTCDVNSFTCIDCLEDRDCSEPGKLVCDRPNQSCVACLVNSDCKEGSEGSNDNCDTDNKTCVDCVDDSGCRTGSNNRCDVDAQTCVQCLEDQDCGTGHCFDQRCVNCEADEHCTDSAKARCDLSVHDCAGCERDLECNHIPGLPACFESSCVECEDDSTCDGRSCLRQQHVCSDVQLGSLSVCESCAADSMCQSSVARCVGLSFGNEFMGTFCLLRESQVDGDDCLNARPYSRPLAAPSVDGNSTSSYCAPPSRTTCQGVLDATPGEGSRVCNDSTQCGAPGVEDASCSGSRCTYVCDVAEDCPVSLICQTGGTCG